MRRRNEVIWNVSAWKNKLPFCLILKIAKLNYILSFKKIYTITGIAGITFTLSLFEWKR